MKNSNWHGGKGSTPRTNTSSKQYQDNWDTIFGKKPKDQQLKQKQHTELNWDGDIEYPQRTNINTRK